MCWSGSPGHWPAPNRSRRGGSEDARVRAAVEAALALGCADAAAIVHLAAAEDLARARGAFIELGELARFERPLPEMTNYDALLGQEVAS